MNFSQRLLWFLAGAMAFVLGIKNLLEPDMWWYLRAGEWIVQNRAIPTRDVFSYTFMDAPWFNVKWLYEVIIYFLECVGGPAFITIWQAIVNVATLAVSWLLFKEMRGFARINADITWWLWGMVAALFISEFRWTSRPESISHGMTLVYLWLMARHYRQPDKWIWLLIPLQLLWSNLHEAFAIGLVLATIYAASPMLEYYLRKKRFMLPDRQTLLILGGVYAAVIINPRGYELYTQAIDIFGQLDKNKFTNELLPFSSSFYQNQWQAKAVWLMAPLALGWLLWEYFRNKRMPFPVFYLVAMLAMSWLAISALRNIPFLALTLVPAMGCGLWSLLHRRFTVAFAVWIWIPVLAAGYVWVAGNYYYEFSGSRDRFGMDMSGDKHPQGLVNYLAKNPITGNHFSDYLSANYPLWALRNNHKSFIDLRDLDVFPAEFFKDILLVSKIPQYFDEFDQRHDFKYAFIKRSDFMSLVTYLYKSPHWQLAHVDAVTALFIKTDTLKNEVVFQPPAEMEIAGFCKNLNRIFWPFYKPQRRKENPAYDAALFYLVVGEYAKALQHAQGLPASESAFLSGKIYSNMIAGSANKDSVLQLAFDHLNKAIQLDKKNEASRIELGILMLNSGNAVEAASQFNRLIKNGTRNVSVYTYLAYCQNMLQSADPANAQIYVKRWFELMEKAADLEPDNLIIRYQLGVSYCDRGDCENARRFILNLGPQPELSDADIRRLEECQKICR